MSVSLSANESMPGDPVTLHVRGEKGSCVCVATVDKSLYLLKPDFQLSPDKVSVEFKVIFHSFRHSASFICRGCTRVPVFPLRRSSKSC